MNKNSSDRDVGLQADDRGAAGAEDEGRRARRETVVVDRQGVTQFVVSLFAKLRPVAGSAGAEG